MIGRLDFVVAFGLAAGVHVAGLGYYAASGGFEGAGAEGPATLSLAAAPAELSELVAEWEAVPDVSLEVLAIDTPAIEDASIKVDAWTDTRAVLPTTKLSDAPDLALAPVVERSESPVLASVALPFQSVPVVKKDMKVASVATPSLPDLSRPAHTFRPPEAVEHAVLATPRPVKRPERSAPAPAVVARGTGGGVSAGNLGATKAVATVSPAARQAAQMAWAGKIQSRIGRYQSYPRGERGQGRVRLQMDILADGRLQAVRIDRSSGVAAFDKAALRAARAAAPFPPAPKGLEQARYAFAQWVNFSR